MSTSDWISHEQREGLVRQLQDSLQALVFAKGGSSTTYDGNWGEIAVSLEARAFRATLFHSEASGDRLSTRAAVQSLYAREASLLLIDEVLRVTRATTNPQRTFSLNPVPEGLRKVQTNHYTSRRISPSAVWGWLVPGSRALQQHVALRGAGVAIGRGKEAMWASMASQQSPRMGSIPQRAGVQQRMQEVTRRNLRFVEVADGRVSRLHCLITLTLADSGPQAFLEDTSSNGTFLNGVKLGKGDSVSLSEGDRISLVLSVAPLAEQFFTFHSHTPPELDPDLDFAAWPESASTSNPPSFNAAAASPREGSRPGLPPVSTSLWRTATSRYTTAEQSTLEDLRCQICLGSLAACLALEPCGHNFCAACLSYHFATQSQGGLQLACPFRCPAPERVIINHAVRALVDLLQQQQQQQRQQHQQQQQQQHQQQQQQQRSAPGTVPVVRPFADGRHTRHVTTSANARPPATSPSQPSSLPPRATASSPEAASASPPANPAACSSDTEQESPCSSDRPGDPSHPASGDGEAGGEGGEEGGGPQMSELFPLHDDQLPMDASSLKAKQVEVALQQLKAPIQDSTAHNVSLEALARLAWSDDTVREVVASSGGILAIVEVMKMHKEHDGVQCNACLALMALVRGEGDVCQANQWHIAKAGAVEAIVQAMHTFSHSSSVQLSALLCCIPLVLDNTMMQAHVTVAALPRVLAALTAFPEEPDIQTKGLVLLGVLMQGEDVVHDAVRQKELEAGLTGCIAGALQRFHDNDDVLWAALFCLAVLVRETSKVFHQAAMAVARSGMHRLLRDMVTAYTSRQAAAGAEADEMIVCTGEYLGLLLQPLLRRMQLQKACLAAGAAACLGVGIALWRMWGHADRGV